MSGPFLSDMWYRVANLRPRLHPNVHIFRQRFRGRAWYVLQDRSSGRVHRFTPATYALINGMDGQRTLDSLWSSLAESLGDHAPSQDEVIQQLYQLHAADVLQAGELPDLAEAVERKRKQVRAVWMRNLINPMALRFPLWDPNRFLEATWPAMKWFFSPLAAAIWTVVVVTAMVQAAQHWRPLTENFADQLFGLQNLFWLWLTYPLIKICHELGHAYAVKHGGGEVHELGLMFLVLAPVPYVDASVSAAFRSKWQRIGVAAAGIIVEVFIASLALFVWLAVEQGAVRAIAFNVMLIAGVSTIVFNGNPLLRFDGYYMLSDFLEIPNLAQRSNQFVSYLVKRYVFGQRNSVSPGHSAGEAAWFALYAPISWVYRLLIMVAIGLFIASRYFFIGVVLALWSIFSMLVWPLIKGLKFTFTGAELDQHRKRALAVVGGGGLALMLAVVVIPAPYWTNAEGVVWVPQNAEVRAASGGFVARLLAVPGRTVTTGEPLLELADRELSAEISVGRARVDQLEVQLASEMYDNRVKAELTRQTLQSERAVLVRAERRSDDLMVLAGREGEWVVPNATDLNGKFYPQGSLIGYVVSGSLHTVRVVVPQEAADQVRGEVRSIQVKLADRPWDSYQAKITREVPGGSEQLPSKALTLHGGGLFATDTRDNSGLKTLVRTFQFDLELDGNATDLVFGMRAFVRFELPYQPIAVQVYRSLRQLLLAHLNV